MNSKQRSDFEAPPTSSLEAIARCVPPMGIDFGYCCVGGSETTRSFVLSNTLPKGVACSTVRFALKLDENHFSVSPDNGKPHLHYNSCLGTLQARKSQEITITFKSQEAKVMIALIVIKLTDV